MHPPCVHDSGLKVSPIDNDGTEGIEVSQQSEPDSPVNQTKGESDTSDIEAMKSKKRPTTSKSRPTKRDALTLSASHAQRTEMMKKMEVEERRLDTESVWKEKELQPMEKRIDTEREVKLLDDSVEGIDRMSERAGHRLSYPECLPLDMKIV